MNEASTEHLRPLILQPVPTATETDRADALTCTVSCQRATHPDRHVWIGTDLRGPGMPPEGIGSDREDWSTPWEWENAVARVRCVSIHDALDLVSTWWAGGNRDGAIPMPMWAKAMPR